MFYKRLFEDEKAIVKKIAEETVFSTEYVASIFVHCSCDESNTRSQLGILGLGGPILPSEYWRRMRKL